MFLLFKKNVCSQCILLSLLWSRKEKTVKMFTKRNRKSKKSMSNVWVVRLTCVSRVIETVCSVFISVSVIHCNVWAYVVFQLPFSMVTMLEHYEICLWFQGLWKHISVIANVISIAYCLVVLSISLIPAFISDVFMWFGEIDFGKLPFLEHKIYKYWFKCVKLGLFDGAMVLVQ